MTTFNAVVAGPSAPSSPQFSGKTWKDRRISLISGMLSESGPFGPFPLEAEQFHEDVLGEHPNTRELFANLGTPVYRFKAQHVIPHRFTSRFQDWKQSDSASGLSFRNRVSFRAIEE
jgi:hypothetical protein